jgi:hypothetical protein
MKLYVVPMGLSAISVCVACYLKCRPAGTHAEALHSLEGKNAGACLSLWDSVLDS